MALAFLDEPESALDSACIAEVAPPAFTSTSVEVEMVPFEAASGLRGMRPESWNEVVPGVFQQSPLVALTQQVVPGVTEALLLQQIASQLGLAAPPEPADGLETGHASWRIYALEDLGQAVSLGIAEHEGNLLLVQLSTPPLRRDAYYAEVFVPAVEAFDPPGG
jgi:hypothetical protein